MVRSEIQDGRRAARARAIAFVSRTAIGGALMAAGAALLLSLLILYMGDLGAG